MGSKSTPRYQPTNSANLTKAQEALSTFESHPGEDDAVRYLSEGLDWLDGIVMDASEEAVKAQAIGDRYAAVAVKYVKDVLASGNATEPELEQARHPMRELNEYEFGDVDAIKSTAFETAARLFDKRYTGYSNKEQIKILERMLDEAKRRT